MTRSLRSAHSMRLLQPPADLVDTGLRAGFAEFATQRAADADGGIASEPTFILIAPGNSRMCGRFATPPAEGVLPIRCTIAELVSSLREPPSISTV